jgi:hypothetical protein
MADVRANAGVPVAANFAGISTPTPCAPLIVDSSTGKIYSQKSDGTVVNPLTGGITATITTAKLTGGGANGSMTFTNGLLTALTPAT